MFQLDLLDFVKYLINDFVYVQLMSVDCSDLRDFPCGSWVKLTTRLGQDIEGEVLSYRVRHFVLFATSFLLRF